MGGKSPQNVTTSGTSSQKTNTTQTTTIPEFLKPFLHGAADVSGGALTDLQGLTERFAVPGLTTDALEGTARGDFLLGGPGFDAAVDASVRAAQPHILSTFGAAGRGTGGLAQAAIGRAATDAFASQYGQERARQLLAAQALPGLALMPLQLRQSLLGSALAGLPISSLFGFNQRGKTSGRTAQVQPVFQNQGAGIMGGALTGLGIGSAMAPAGATGLAALGGPMGLGLALAGGLAGGLLQ